MSKELQIVDTYKSGSIEVKVLKGCEFKPRPPRSTVESSNEKYATESEVHFLIDWCSKSKTKKYRRTLIAEYTGINLHRIRGCITRGHPARLTRKEHKQIMSVLKAIEAFENQSGSKAA